LAERVVDAGPAHAAECETEEEIPVLVHLDRFVESAGLDDGCATKHHRDRMREIAEEEATADVPLLARPSLMREPDPVAVDHVPACVDQADVRARIEDGRLP